MVLWTALAVALLHGGGFVAGQNALSGLFNSYQSYQSSPPAQASPPAQGGASGFITVSGQTLADQACKSFVPIGFNAWTDVNYAAYKAAQSLSSSVNIGLQTDAVALYFKNAAAAGFNTVRIFGHGNSTSFALQKGPGNYDETVFRAFDYILALAGYYKLKVIFVVINNWLDAAVGGGKLQYCKWANLSNEDFFWTDSGAMQLVKNHLGALASRVNYFTGTAWKQDSTILQWELFYEPRCPALQQGAGCPGPVTSWFDSMSTYMRSQDPNHLVSTGEEGFFAVNSSLTQSNPTGIPSQLASQGASWASQTGQDFEEQHRRPNIGTATFQMWPDNWATSSDPNFVINWLNAHVTAAQSLGKPLILTEFGMAVTEPSETSRVAMIRSVFAVLQQSLVGQSAFNGALFWRWPINAASADRSSVGPSQASYNAIQDGRQQVQAYLGRTVAGCGTPNINVLAFQQTPGRRFS